MRTLTIIGLLAGTLLIAGCEGSPQRSQDRNEDRADLSAAPSPSSPSKEVESKEVNTPEPIVTGESLYRSCIPCHGAGGQEPALGVGEAIAGWPEDRLVETISAYRDGTRNSHGMGGTMSAQARQLSDEDIARLAEHISKL